MDSQKFVDSLVSEIIQPGVQRLLETRYFSELREGKLSVKRLQGFALQHYLHNVSINKGFALCMVKNAHIPDLYEHFAHQFTEEDPHPNLAKRFGLALGLKEEDFKQIHPVFECVAHTSAVLRGMLLGAAGENRAGALVNETMVCRYSEEFNTYLHKHYRMSDEDCEFFSVHAVADVEHTKLNAEVIARYARSDADQEAARVCAQNMVRFKIAKFDGIYESYT
jgi:pyrroloquinoline quinone (PQQ) biosynthesis protein C